MGEFIKAQGVEIAADGAFSQAILMKDWHIIWLSFALYALVIAIAFAILFKHKHDPKIVEQLNH
jgi:NHS family xanthosine MFS transporter